MKISKKARELLKDIDTQIISIASLLPSNANEHAIHLYRISGVLDGMIKLSEWLDDDRNLQ